MKFKLRSKSGTAVVEFAVILPLLVVILFGIIEFSILFYDKAMITNASREGARLGIVYRIDSSNNYLPPDSLTVKPLVEAAVENYLQNYLISFSPAATKTILIEVTGTSPGGELKVTVTYPYQFLIIPKFISSIAPTIFVSAVTSMRLE